jgi:hypothetical protein
LRLTRRRPIDTPPGECYDVRRRRSASPARVLSSQAFYHLTRAGAGQRKKLARPAIVARNMRLMPVNAGEKHRSEGRALFTAQEEDR